MGVFYYIDSHFLSVITLKHKCISANGKPIGERIAMGEKKGVVMQEYLNQYVSLSNALIRAKERTSVLESKIEVLAIHHMDKNVKIREKKDKYGNSYFINYVQLSAVEIRNLMGNYNGKIYNDIYMAAMALKEKLYIYEDREAKSFIMKSMYENVAYDKGIMTIEFNPEMEDYYLNLKENYTKLSLPIFFSFHKNGGLQLYKLLKSYAYNLPKIDLAIDQEELPFYSIYFNLTELRMILGYVDLNQDKLKKEGSKKKPNFEKMARDEINPQYKRWSDFNIRVIVPGVKEVNDISDIYIMDVQKKAVGRGGKIEGLTFYIQYNKKYFEAQKKGIINVKENKIPNSKKKNENKKDNIADVIDFIDEMKEIIPYILKTKDYLAIAEAANYDLLKIKNATDAMNSYSSKISNVAGFLISAIQKGFHVNSVNRDPMIVDKMRPRERQYTIDDYCNMESILLNNSIKDNDEIEDDVLLKQVGSS